MEGSEGVWVQPDGSARRVRLGAGRVKGGPLFEAFHGIGESLWRRNGGDLGASRVDLARAYASVVWAYRCIKLRADSLASVPLALVDGGGERIDDHPILDLLRDVNPHTMNLGDLLRATEAAYNIWGSAYWLKVKGGSRTAPTGGNGYNGHGNGHAPRNPNRVRWLEWLNPQTVEVISDPVRGIVGYKQTVGTRTRLYAPEEVIAFRNFDPLDDLGGLSPLSVALSEINAEINAARFVASFFANDARPAGLLTTDQPLKEGEMERVRTWWQRLFQGAANKWKTGIVGLGLKWQTISFPPTDLALSELRAEDRRAICAVFGVPAGMAGAWEATTYATAREQKASFYEDTLIPQMEYITEVLNWSLVPHYPDLVARGARLVFDVDSISALHETADDKSKRVIALYQAGIMTLDEARAEMGLTAREETSPPVPLSIDGEGETQGDAVSSEADVTGKRVEVTKASSAQALTPSETGSLARALTPSPHSVDASHRRWRGGNGKRALQAELDRWERFAVKRMRAGRTLRAFRSAAIPPEVWWRVATGLGEARSVDEVRRVFNEASQHFSVSALQPTAEDISLLSS